VSTQIALLRGINLGPHHKVPMAELRDLSISLDLHNPTTYIRSGNLVFDVAPGDIGFSQRLETALSDRYGFDIPVVTRSKEELEQLASEHPLASPELEDRFLMVAFLDSEPDVAMDEVIDSKEFEPDRFDQRGRNVYLAYPGGIGRSKLSHDLIQRRLGVRATIRNWRTILRLVEMADPETRL
jgi:uncharacterized protein (DUF1697 family)